MRSRERRRKVYLAVLTQYQRVTNKRTDRQTDKQTDEIALSASRINVDDKHRKELTRVALYLNEPLTFDVQVA